MSRASSAALGMATLAALLAACERPSPAPTPTPSATKLSRGTSIIRPDVEAEVASEPVRAPLQLRIDFGEGGSELSRSAIATLEDAVASEQMKASGTVMLAGHSDSAGSDKANLAASRHRAEAVRDWLVDHGIAGERITIVAFGEQNPVAPNALPDGTPRSGGAREEPARRNDHHAAAGYHDACAIAERGCDLGRSARRRNLMRQTR